MSSPKMLLPILCLLGLACTAFAQNLTASRPLQNLTLISQDMNNFTNQALPSFPCDGIRPGVAGGYSNLDLNDENTFDNSLVYILDAVYTYYQYATVNLTDCSLNSVDGYNVSSACSQVVAGTNYAVELEVLYDCIGLDTEIASETFADLRATVFVPLSAGSFQTEDQQENGPVIQDVWFASPPEVIAFSEAIPEEGPPEEEAPAPEAEPETSNDNTTSTQLLTPSSGGSLGLGSGSNSQLAFSSSPSATSSPSPASSSSTTQATPEPEPQIVQGFDVAAQNRSIVAG